MKRVEMICERGFGFGNVEVREHVAAALDHVGFGAHRIYPRGRRLDAA